MKLSDGAIASAIVGIVDSAGPSALLLRRFDTDRDFPSFWCFPGGRVRRGETASQAVRREAHEETGLEVGRLEALGRGESVGLSGRRFLVDCFVTESWSGSVIRFPSSEHGGFAWVPIVQLTDLAPVGPTTRWLATIIQSRFRAATSRPRPDGAIGFPDAPCSRSWDFRP